mgnify:CR=1 FL=1
MFEIINESLSILRIPEFNVEISSTIKLILVLLLSDSQSKYAGPEPALVLIDMKIVKTKNRFFIWLEVLVNVA